MGEAHLVQAARVTVEEHTHALVEELAGSLLSELVLLAIDGSTEEWDSDVGTVACSDRRRGIGRAKEIYVAEEPVGRGRALLALGAGRAREGPGVGLGEGGTQIRGIAQSASQTDNREYYRVAPNNHGVFLVFLDKRRSRTRTRGAIRVPENEASVDVGYDVLKAI